MDSYVLQLPTLHLTGVGSDGVGSPSEGMSRLRIFVLIWTISGLKIVNWDLL